MKGEVELIPIISIRQLSLHKNEFLLILEAESSSILNNRELIRELEFRNRSIGYDAEEFL